MKSLTAVCQTGATGAATASMPSINANGRISRHPHTRGDGENAEMKMYLSKLKDLVPFMPKNRKLSKLEIIQHVIDYICDLQNELETHPEIGNFDAAGALNLNAVTVSKEHDARGIILSANHQQAHECLIAHFEQQQQQLQQHQQQQPASPIQHQQQQQHSSPAMRQPLVVLQTPNTILPMSPQTTHHQQQQSMPTAMSPNNSHVSSAADKESRQQNC